MASSAKLKSGLTIKAILALFFSSAIFMPVGLYLALVSGAGLGGAHAYIVLILFIEIASLIGVQITKQELYIILTLMQVGTVDMFGFVFRQYLVTSPISWSFRDPYTGKPIPEVIPTFFVPYWKSIEFTRTYLQSAWLIPVLLSITMTALTVLADFALTIIFSQLYIETEKLPFPFAQIPSSIVNTLSDRTSSKMETFILAMLASIIYSFVLYGANIIASGLWNIRVQVLPIPWIDLTTGVFGIEKYLPGAALGIATDPLAWFSGFLIPFPTVVYLFIGSILTWIIGNNLALTVFSNIFPHWKDEWTYGMTLSLVYQRSTLRVWIIPQLGISLAVVALTLIQQYKSILRAFKSLLRASYSSESSSHFPSLSMLLVLYLFATSFSVLIFHIFIPDFPIIIALLVSTVFSFINALIGSRAVGETGYGVSIPYVWPATILLSGYKKIDVWFLSPVIAGYTTPGWVQNIKVAQLTETEPMDFFKGYFFAFIFDLIFGLIYANLFWSISPIPSSNYPNTLITWPVNVINTLMWATRQVFTANVGLLTFFFGLTFIVGVSGTLISKFIPFSFMGLVSGTGVLPAYSIPLLISGIVGKFIMPKIFGESWWNENKSILVAGIATGEGIVVGISTVLVLLAKIGWVLPI